MDKELHLEFLKKKYIELSRQYLNEMHNGKGVNDLKDLSDVIKILIKEIELLEDDDEELNG